MNKERNAAVAAAAAVASASAASNMPNASSSGSYLLIFYYKLPFPVLRARVHYAEFSTLSFDENINNKLTLCFDMKNGASSLTSGFENQLSASAQFGLGLSSLKHAERFLFRFVF